MIETWLEAELSCKGGIIKAPSGLAFVAEVFFAFFFHRGDYPVREVTLFALLIWYLP